jgi:hypothetical protein
MKLTLNKNLLTVLLMVSHKKALLINESHIGLCKDWLKALKQYYHSIPDDIIQRLALKKSHTCFMAIACFTVPDEWLSTEEDDLPNFEFAY